MALGSAGSNRIRSAILQTILSVVDRGLSAQEAVDAPRLHFEADVVEAEPGIDPAALDALEERGLEGLALPREATSTSAECRPWRAIRRAGFPVEETRGGAGPRSWSSKTRNLRRAWRNGDV